MHSVLRTASSFPLLSLLALLGMPVQIVAHVPVVGLTTALTPASVVAVAVGGAVARIGRIIGIERRRFRRTR
jgi:hypothetical protein